MTHSLHFLGVIFRVSVASGAPWQQRIGEKSPVQHSIRTYIPMPALTGFGDLEH